MSGGGADEVVQQWEYKVIRAGTVHIGWGKKKLDSVVKDMPLDPDVDWFTASRWIDYHDQRWANVASSDGFWTTMPKRLSELGAEGWELVGTTPPEHLPGVTRTDFSFLLKRPVSTG